MCVINAKGNHFCSGIDLNYLKKIVEPTPIHKNLTSEVEKNSAIYSNILNLQACFTCLENAKFPIIAAIQGGCIGAAMSLVSACDLRYATGDAYFLIQESNLGFCADLGVLQRLNKLIPEGIAKEWAFLGESISAKKACQTGFINDCFESKSDLDEYVMNVAYKLVQKPKLTLWGTKKMILDSKNYSIQDSLDTMAIWQAAMLNKEDIKQRILKFEK